MTQQNNSAFPLMLSIVVMDPTELKAVYAVLGGTALASGNVLQQPQRALAESVKQDTGQSSVGSEISAPANQESDGTGPTVSQPAATASPSDGVDAHGHPWSPDLHASTKGKTKDGLWRMKVGVTRPDPLPGFPAATDTGTSNAGTAAEATPSATLPTATEAESAPPATSAPEPAAEDDEFAAFRAAAATSDAQDAAAVAAVPERQYSDADLGALCNQAAVKLGDPNPVKELIARFVPTGEVAHSRNIPAEKRTEFVKEVETKAGIAFAG